VSDTISEPTVSVCIPVFNGAEYIAQAIDSVLQQSFKDFELLICDDASSDGTPGICKSYGDPRIRYIRYNENAGQAGNFNRCSTEARGKLLTLLSADDYFLPGLLEDRVRRLNEHPEVGFVVGSMRIVDARGIETSTSCAWTEERFFEPGEFLNSLLFGAVVNTLSLVFRKNCLDRIGLFRTDLTWGHDWEWIMRLAEHFGSIYAIEPLVAYREHEASGTAEQLNAARNGPQERRILNDTLTRLSVDKRFQNMRRPVFQALSRRHMYFAEQALIGGRRAVARNNLYYAAMSDSGMLVRPTFWALVLGSIGSQKLYSRYRGLRNDLVG